MGRHIFCVRLYKITNADTKPLFNITLYIKKVNKRKYLCGILSKFERSFYAIVHTEFTIILRFVFNYFTFESLRCGTNSRSPSHAAPACFAQMIHSTPLPPLKGQCRQLKKCKHIVCQLNGQITVCRANRNNDIRPVGAHDITPTV